MPWLIRTDEECNSHRKTVADLRVESVDVDHPQCHQDLAVQQFQAIWSNQFRWTQYRLEHWHFHQAQVSVEVRVIQKVLDGIKVVVSQVV